MLGLHRWSKELLREAALTGGYAREGRTPSGTSRRGVTAQLPPTKLEKHRSFLPLCFV